MVAVFIPTYRELKGWDAFEAEEDHIEVAVFIPTYRELKDLLGRPVRRSIRQVAVFIPTYRELKEASPIRRPGTFTMLQSSSQRIGN